jgi:hypothetical protein
LEGQKAQGGVFGEGSGQPKGTAAWENANALKYRVTDVKGDVRTPHVLRLGFDARRACEGLAVSRKPNNHIFCAMYFALPGIRQSCHAAGAAWMNPLRADLKH